MPLHQTAPHLWTHDQDLRFMGIEVGARMTVIDVDGRGSLLVHSPNHLTEELRASLDGLGLVRWIISPNKWHHLYITEFRQAYPEAQHFCAPGLEKKRSDFPFDAVISDSQSYPWNPALAHCTLQGVPMYNEVVFFHPESRTLVLTDLAVHICESRSLVTKIALSLIGSYGKFGWSPVEKFLFIKNPPAFQASLEKILAWDFDRIVLSHGSSVESGGKARLRAAFAHS